MNNFSCSTIGSSPPLTFVLGGLLDETKHGFFNPVEKALKEVDISELKCQVECISSRFGWVLILSRQSSSIFFFNPLTRQKIDIPYRNSIISAVTFSAPPTSPNCTVYAVTMPIFSCKLYVDAFHIDQQDKRWVRHTFKPTSIESKTVIQSICCNGVLYCVDLQGRITIFDEKHSSWNRIPCARAREKAFRSFCKPYLVEFNGNIYAAKKELNGEVEELHMLKFDQDGKTYWKEVKDLGDITLFHGQ